MWNYCAFETLLLNARILKENAMWFSSIGEIIPHEGLGVYPTGSEKCIKDTKYLEWQSAIVFKNPKVGYIIMKRTNPVRKYVKVNVIHRNLVRIPLEDFPELDDDDIEHLFDFCMHYSELHTILDCFDKHSSLRDALKTQIVEYIIGFMDRGGMAISGRCAKDLVKFVKLKDALRIFPGLCEMSRKNLYKSLMNQKKVNVRIIREMYPDFGDAPVMRISGSDWASYKKLHDAGFPLSETIPIQYAMWDQYMHHPVTENGCLLATYRNVLLGIGQIEPFCHLNISTLDVLCEIVARFARCGD